MPGQALGSEIESGPGSGSGIVAGEASISWAMVSARPSISDSSWVAIGVMRRRAVPTRNRGMTDPLGVVAPLEELLTDRASCARCRRARRAGCGSCSDRSGFLPPPAASAGDRNSPAAAARRQGSSSTRRRATRDASTWAGASAQEKMKLRAVFTSRSRSFAGARHEGAEGAEGFSEGAHHDVDLVEHAGGLARAAAAGAEGARAVGVVEQHEGVGLVGELHDLGDRRDVSIHAVDAVDRDQHAPRRGRAPRRASRRDESTSPWRKTATSGSGRAARRR